MSAQYIFTVTIIEYSAYLKALKFTRTVENESKLQISLYVFVYNTTGHEYIEFFIEVSL